MEAKESKLKIYEIYTPKRLILLVLISSYIIFKIYVNSLIDINSPHYFGNISDAYKKKTLLAKYRIASYEGQVRDSLSRYGYTQILDTLNFFYEYMVQYSPKYLCFTQKKRFPNPVLIYRSPFLSSCNNIRYYHHIIGKKDYPDLLFGFEKVAPFDITSSIILCGRSDMFDINDITLKCFFGRVSYTPYEIYFTELGKIKLEKIYETDDLMPAELRFFWLYPDFPSTTIKCY